MQKVKRAISTILAVFLMLMVCTSYLPVSAAAPKVVKPQVKLNTAPLKQYMVGDKVSVNVSAPNYSGKVQYRVMLINAKGGYKELYSTSDHYSKPIVSGKTTLAINFPTTQEGTYSLQVLVKRNGVKVSYDTLVKTASFTVAPSSVVYSRAGNTYKYDKTANIDVDSKIISKDITVDNANFAKSLYVTANNVTLKNINVKGTLSLDPGKDGAATLENVTANEIKVLSGAENSIHLKSVNANKLVVDSDSKVRVVSTGTTKVGSTEVTLYAILDSQGGSLGTITVSSTAAGTVDVEFRGTFTEPIVVQTQANIKAAAGANIAKVEIAPVNNQTVKLEGTFKDVQVTKEAKVEVAADAKITGTLSLTAKAEIKADAKSEVAKVVIAPPTKDTVIKLEGTFKTVEITKESKIELGAGTVVKNVLAEVSAEIKLGTGAKVEELNKGQGLDSKTEGGSITITPGGTTTPPATGGGSPGGNNGGGNTTPAKPTITSIAGESVTGLNISLPTSKITKQMVIKVSKDSVTAVIIPGLGDMGGFQLKELQDNTILNIPMPGLEPINFEAVNATVLFNALKGANSSTKQALVEGINFGIILNSLQNADPNTKVSIIRALNITNLLTAMQNAGTASKTEFYNNIARMIELTINDKNKVQLLGAIYSTELANVLTREQKDALLAVASGGSVADIDFEGIFKTIQASGTATQNVIFEKINFQTIYNVIAGLNNETKNQIFAAINFTNIFDAVLDADSSTKTKFYEDIIAVINIVETGNAITRSVLLSAFDFSKMTTQQKYEILDRLDGKANDGLKVQIVLEAGGQSNTYEITITNN